MRIKLTELAWSAGFLDGEGHFGSYQNGRTAGCAQRYRIQCAQVVREPLERLVAVLGGKAYGPYGPYSTNKQPYYQWIIEADAARVATNQLMPYLCRVKREQARVAMEVAA